MAASGALLLELDSLAQAALWATTHDSSEGRHALAPDSGRDAQADLESVTQSLSALCRTTVLFADRIVLTDAQVFDGAILLRVGVDGVLDWVGATRHTALVQVKLRSSTAAESLHELRSNPRMRWQIGGSTSHVPDALMALQDRWARAIDDGTVASSRWREGFDFTGSLESRLRLSFPPGVGSESVHVPTRSLAHDAIDRLPLSESARQTWRSAWDAAYMGTLAEQHECRWVSLEQSAPAVLDEAVAAGVTPRKLQTEAVPSAVTDRLRGLSPGEFGRLIDSLSHLRRSSQRRRWLDRFRLSLGVMELTRPARPIRDLVLAFVRILAFAILVAVTLTDVTDVSIDTWLLVSVGVLLVLMQAPVVEIGQIAALARKDARALLREPISRGAP